MNGIWVDQHTAALIGVGAGTLSGVWGGMVGGLSGWLIPQCRGRVWLLGLIWAGGGVGGLLLGYGLAAAAAGKSFQVWGAFVWPGLMLAAFAGYGVPLTRRRYRWAEEQRMARQDAI